MALMVSTTTRALPTMFFTLLLLMMGMKSISHASQLRPETAGKLRRFCRRGRRG